MAAVFVTSCVLDYLVHFRALMDFYKETAQIWRSPYEMQTLSLYASQLIFSIMFVYLYTLNYKHKGHSEGVRFGTLIGVLLAGTYLASYTYMPIPFALTISWMAAVTIKCIICGLVASIVYNDFHYK